MTKADLGMFMEPSKNSKKYIVIQYALIFIICTFRLITQLLRRTDLRIASVVDVNDKQVD